MSKSYIPKNIRTLVKTRAKGYCEYCLLPSSFSPSSFQVDHIQPESKGGKTIQSNLALSCSQCNGTKFTKTSALDKKTEKVVPLYNPRKDKWIEHFDWDNDKFLIVGKTSIGRATVDTLDLNRESNLNLRALLYLVGLHPPIDYP